MRITATNLSGIATRAAVIASRSELRMNRTTAGSPLVQTMRTPARHQVEDPYTDEQHRILAILERVFGLKTQRLEIRTNRPAAGLSFARSSGFELEYLHEQVHYERSAAAFSGKVDTADGRRISFSLAVQWEHLHVTRTHLRIDGEPVDPLVVDLDGRGVSFSSQIRLPFDLSADGQSEYLPLLQPGSAYLALDRNGNGVIDDGHELFGPRTGNGFAELARYDEDGNGWIDAGDSVWSQLWLLRPAPGGDVLMPVAGSGIAAIGLQALATPFTIRDEVGIALANVAATAVALREDGQPRAIHHIDMYA